MTSFSLRSAFPYWHETHILGMVFMVLVASGLGASFVFASGPVFRELTLEPYKGSVNPNLVFNFSFEEIGQDGLPVGWRWDKRNTDATCSVVEDAHSGRRALRFTNGTPFGAHVYGTLWIVQPIPVKPDTTYTLSYFLKAEEPGIGWVGGGKGWGIRSSFRPTSGRWERIVKTFRTGPDETSFTLRLVTESPTPGFLIDDIKLEEGESATACEPQLMGDKPQVYADMMEDVVSDGGWELSFLLFAPKPLPSVTIKAQVSDEERTWRGDLGAGRWKVVLSGDMGEADDTPVAISLEVRGPSGVLLAGDDAQVRFLSPGNTRQRIPAFAREIPAIRELIDKVREKGQDIAYPLVTLTIIENFVFYAYEDASRGEVKRALDQLHTMEAMARRVKEELGAVLEGRRELAEVPRWVASPLEIKGPSFLGKVRWPLSGREEIRPVFFTGYGHFGQVRADIEKFPGYGTNIIQIEFGPNRIFPSEGTVSDAPLRDTLSVLDRAAEAGVAVNLLISPHYFPGWALEKWPHLRIRREGFLQYCIHAPEGQELLQRYLEFIIPKLKDHPALHSICLTNEPVNAEDPSCPYARKLWHEWLVRRYGRVEVLNEKWRTHYASFDAIPLPEARVTPTPEAYEFVLFNQEFFADWHRKLADTIHRIAPDLPVHAKAMTWNFFSDQDQRLGVDAELFGAFSQINGNDATNFYNHGVGEWAQNWFLNHAGHDLQRSVKDAPVFNSENHIIVDREKREIPPEHVRTVLWQEAIHGQSATTIWVWERTFDPQSDLAGSVMHRPACVEAVGRTALDLMRLANEVTAFQVAPAQVSILYSTGSLVYDGGETSDCMRKLYMALTLSGLKVGWVTERQLAAGHEPITPVIFVPNARHLPQVAWETLCRWNGHVVLVGDSCLKWDEFGRERDVPKTWIRVPFARVRTSERGLWEELRPLLTGLGLRPEIEVIGPDGEPVWGIEWRVARLDGRTLVNLVNLRNESVTVRLEKDGQALAGRDLLTDERWANLRELRPLEVRLIEVGERRE